MNSPLNVGFVSFRFAKYHKPIKLTADNNKTLIYFQLICGCHPYWVQM